MKGVNRCAFGDDNKRRIYCGQREIGQSSSGSLGRRSRRAGGTVSNHTHRRVQFRPFDFEEPARCGGRAPRLLCGCLARGGGIFLTKKPLAWILTIVRNLCLQRLRDCRKTQEAPAEDWESQLPSDHGISVEDRTVLRTCLQQLNDEERQIVALHAVSGFKHREIAALLNLPLSTVLSKYHRALKKLKEYLQ